MYKPTIWQDHVEGVQEGTDMNAANFNNIEVGTMEANALAAMNSAHQRYATDKAKETEVIVVECGLLFSPEAPSSDETFVAIPNNVTRNNTNYIVAPIVTFMTGGDGAGIVEISDKQANGFKARFTGDFTQMTIKFLISGGMI